MYLSLLNSHPYSSGSSSNTNNSSTYRSVTRPSTTQQHQAQWSFSRPPPISPTRPPPPQRQDLARWYYQGVRLEENWDSKRNEIEYEECEEYRNWLNKVFDDEHESDLDTSLSVTSNALHVASIQTDLRSGIRFLRLLEILFENNIKTLPKETGLLKMHHMRNMETCLGYLKQRRKVKVIGINSIDLAEGHVKMTLGLLFLIRHNYETTLNDDSAPSICSVFKRHKLITNYPDRNSHNNSFDHDTSFTKSYENPYKSNDSSSNNGTSYEPAKNNIFLKSCIKKVSHDEPILALNAEAEEIISESSDQNSFSSSNDLVSLSSNSLLNLKNEFNFNVNNDVEKNKRSSLIEYTDHEHLRRPNVIDTSRNSSLNSSSTTSSSSNACEENIEIIIDLQVNNNTIEESTPVNEERLSHFSFDPVLTHKLPIIEEPLLTSDTHYIHVVDAQYCIPINPETQTVAAITKTETKHIEPKTKLKPEPPVTIVTKTIKPPNAKPTTQSEAPVIVKLHTKPQPEPSVIVKRQPKPQPEPSVIVELQPKPQPEPHVVTLIKTVNPPADLFVLKNIKPTQSKPPVIKTKIINTSENFVQAKIEKPQHEQPIVIAEVKKNPQPKPVSPIVIKPIDPPEEVITTKKEKESQPSAIAINIEPKPEPAMSKNIETKVESAIVINEVKKNPQPQLESPTIIKTIDPLENVITTKTAINIEPKPEPLEPVISKNIETKTEPVVLERRNKKVRKVTASQETSLPKSIETNAEAVKPEVITQTYKEVIVKKEETTEPSKIKIESAPTSENDIFSKIDSANLITGATNNISPIVQHVSTLINNVEDEVSSKEVSSVNSSFAPNDDNNKRIDRTPTIFGTDNNSSKTIQILDKPINEIKSVKSTNQPIPLIDTPLPSSVIINASSPEIPLKDETKQEHSKRKLKNGPAQLLKSTDTIAAHSSNPKSNDSFPAKLNEKQKLEEKNTHYLSNNTSPDTASFNIPQSAANTKSLIKDSKPTTVNGGALSSEESPITPKNSLLVKFEDAKIPIISNGEDKSSVTPKQLLPSKTIPTNPIKSELNETSVLHEEPSSVSTPKKSNLNKSKTQLEKSDVKTPAIVVDVLIPSTSETLPKSLLISNKTTSNEQEIKEITTSNLDDKSPKVHENTVKTTSSINNSTSHKNAKNNNNQPKIQDNSARLNNNVSTSVSNKVVSPKNTIPDNNNQLTEQSTINTILNSSSLLLPFPNKTEPILKKPNGSTAKNRKTQQQQQLEKPIEAASVVLNKPITSEVSSSASPKNKVTKNIPDNEKKVTEQTLENNKPTPNKQEQNSKRKGSNGQQIRKTSLKNATKFTGEFAPANKVAKSSNSLALYYFCAAIVLVLAGLIGYNFLFIEI